MVDAPLCCWRSRRPRRPHVHPSFQDTKQLQPYLCWQTLREPSGPPAPGPPRLVPVRHNTKEGDFQPHSCHRPCPCGCLGLPRSPAPSPCPHSSDSFILPITLPSPPWTHVHAELDERWPGALETAPSQAVPGHPWGEPAPFRGGTRGACPAHAARDASGQGRLLPAPGSSVSPVPVTAPLGGRAGPEQLHPPLQAPAKPRSRCPALAGGRPRPGLPGGCVPCGSATRSSRLRTGLTASSGLVP